MPYHVRRSGHEIMNQSHAVQLQNKLKELIDTDVCIKFNQAISCAMQSRHVCGYHICLSFSPSMPFLVVRCTGKVLAQTIQAFYSVVLLAPFAISALTQYFGQVSQDVLTAKIAFSNALFSVGQYRRSAVSWTWLALLS